MNALPSNRRDDALLLIAAAIWGFAFVAQRAGMEHVGPFLFNGIRFALGSVVLLPLIAWMRTRGTAPAPSGSARLSVDGVLAGLALFAGASLQQWGIVSTGAGKAGFITGLYVILVPVLGLFLGQSSRRGIWMGAALAVAGLFLLSARSGMSMARGDLLVLAGAFFWALHVQLIGRFGPRQNPITLASLQFAVVSAASLLAAVLMEPWSWNAIRAATGPILYAGLASTGVAYTLQVVAQRRAQPGHAAILLSLEAVFAAIGGWMLLSERLGARELAGCALMLAGMLRSQLSGGARRA